MILKLLMFYLAVSGFVVVPLLVLGILAGEIVFNDRCDESEIN